MELYEELVKYIKSLNEKIEIIKIKKEDVIFEKKVNMSCFYCSKYNTRWTCPPKIPKIDYEELISEFDNVLIIYINLKFDDENYEIIRQNSSVILHKSILKVEDFLLKNNQSLFNTFVGGSCKLCKNGCSEDKCRNPGKARIPMEALGINVVKTMEKYGIEIKFPVVDNLYRLGMILY